MNFTKSLVLSLLFNMIFGIEIYERVLRSDHELSMNNELTKCASDIAEKFFFRRQFVALIPAYEYEDTKYRLREDEEYQEIINHLFDFISEFSCVFVVYSGENIPFINCINFVMVIKNVDTLKANLDLIPKNKFDHSGRIVIVLKKPWYSKKDVFDNAREILLACWELKMPNVIVVAYFDGVSLYTHFPFVANNCGYVDVVEIDQWTEDGFVKNANLYPQKTRQLYGCPVVVTAVERYPHTIIDRSNNESLKLRGIEGNLMETLADLINFTLVVTEPNDIHDWGHWDGEKWTGATGDLVYDRADIGVGGYYPSLRRVNVIDISFGYNTVYIVWTVKKVELGLAALKLLLPFRIYVWGSILGTMIVSLLILFTLKNMIKNKTVQSENAAIHFWEVTLGIGVKYLPTGRFVCFVFTVWIWSTLVLRSSYQSSLVGFLTQKYYDDSIQTMKDLLDNQFEFYGSQQLVDVMINVTDNEYVSEILSKLHVIDTSDDVILEQIISGKIYGTIPQYKDRIAEINFLFRDKGNLRVLKEVYRSQIITLPLPKYSPMLDGVNSWINRISEVGLVDKWIDELQWPDVVPDDRPLVLTMHHLIGPFFILVVGESLATLAFFGELVYARSYSNNENLLEKRFN